MRREKKKVEKNIYDNYLAILREEMVPAMGCTEPILEENRSILWQNAPEIL